MNNIPPRKRKVSTEREFSNDSPKKDLAEDNNSSDAEESDQNDDDSVSEKSEANSDESSSPERGPKFGRSSNDYNDEKFSNEEAAESDDDNGEDFLEEENEEENGSSSEEASIDEDKVKEAAKMREQFGSTSALNAIKSLFDAKFNGDLSSRGRYYLLSGGSLEELIAQLEFIDTKRKSHSIVGFQAIQITIIRILQEKLMNSEDLIEICKHFVTNYIVDVLGQLAMPTPTNFKRAAVKLLSALATVGDELALQLLSSIELSKEQLEHLTRHDDPTNPASLRVLFIHFLMALIIGHSPFVIRKLCSKKFWLTSIYYGMKFDLLSTVNLVLVTLDEHIIMNSGVPKTSKLFVFNSKALGHLLNLYNWDPSTYVDGASGRSKYKIEPPHSDDITRVRELAHGVLLHLTTSVKYGVVFHDSSYGMTTLNANATANQFMKESGHLWEDALKEQLFTKLLSTCPDLMKSFYNILTNRLQMHDSSVRWTKLGQFLLKTISNIVIIPASFTSVARAYSVCTQLFLPSLVLDSIQLSVKDQKNVVGTLLGLNIFMITLAKIKEVLTALEQREDHNSSTIFLSKMSNYLSTSSLTAPKLFEILPNTEEGISVPVIEAVCDVFFSLAELFPQTLDPVKFNSNHVKKLGKMVENPIFLKKKENVAKIKLIKLQLLLDPQIVKQEGLFDITEICNLISAKESLELKNLGLSVIRDVLRNTGFFTEDAWERDLWLRCIEKHVEGSFGKKLAAAILYAEENKFELSNTILRSHYHQSSNLFNATDLKLDDFLATEDCDEDATDSDLQDMRLSPLLPAILRATDKMGNVTKAFIIHYAHMVPPDGFFSLVKQSLGRGHPIVDYLEALSSGELITLNFSPFAGSTFDFISKFVLEGKIEPCFDSLESEDAELAASQIIRLAVQSQNHPERMERCVQIMKQLCSFTPESSYALKPENVLRYSGLLEGFHPILVEIGLLNPIVEILGQTIVNHGNPSLRPFAHRIYFEIEYAIRKKMHLEKVERSNLESFLKNFPLTKKNIAKLNGSISKMNSKYFIVKGHLTPWVAILEHLLQETSTNQLVLSNDELTGITRLLTKLVRHQENINIPELLDGYFKRNEVELVGDLHDVSIDLLQALCNADNWYEKLACTLMKKIDGQLIDFPEGIEFQREVLLLHSMPPPLSKNLDHAVRSTVKALSTNQEFLKELAIIASEAYGPEACCKLAAKVEKHLSDIYPSENALKVLEAVFDKAGKSLDLLRLVLTWMETFSTQKPDLCFEISGTLERLSSKSDGSSMPHLEKSIANFMIVQGLNHSNASMIQALQIFLSADRLPLDPSTIFQTLTSHSEFDNILMGTDENLKCSFILLLHTLIEKDGSIINGSRLPGFMSAYRATLSKSDQLLLKILQVHEKCGVNLAGYKPLLWGDAALSHYSVKKRPFLSKSHPYQTLDALNPSLVINTIANFPIHRDVEGVVEGDSLIYDPAFILPVLCQLVLPDNKVTSRRFFQAGAVALCLASLCSHSAKIRNIAALFLQRLHDNHKGQDKLVWSTFINVVRNGIIDLKANQKADKDKKGKKCEKDEVVPRLCSITATFLARASTVLGDPSAPLFRPLHYFVLARPSLKLYGVPAFLELLHSTDVKYHERHREWILEVIRDGTREACDLQMVLNSFTLKILMVFYSTDLAKPYPKRLIEQIVAKCLNGPDNESKLLISKYSILPWTFSAGVPPSVKSALPKMSPFSQHASLLAFVNNKSIETT